MKKESEERPSEEDDDENDEEEAEEKQENTTDQSGVRKRVMYLWHVVHTFKLLTSLIELVTGSVSINM